MIAQTYGFENWDEGKAGSKADAIKKIEDDHKKSIAIIYGSQAAPGDEELDENNQFLAPALRATREIKASSVSAGEKVKDLITKEDLDSLDQ